MVKQTTEMQMEKNQRENTTVPHSHPQLAHSASKCSYTFFHGLRLIPPCPRTALHALRLPYPIEDIFMIHTVSPTRTVSRLWLFLFKKNPQPTPALGQPYCSLMPTFSTWLEALGKYKLRHHPSTLQGLCHYLLGKSSMIKNSSPFDPLSVGDVVNLGFPYLLSAFPLFTVHKLLLP